MSNLVDPILSSLSPDDLWFVEDQLSNNEVASDEELQEMFIDNGLTELQAVRAIRYRNAYLMNIFLSGHTPILKGKNSLRFNPHRAQFEIFTQ